MTRIGDLDERSLRSEAERRFAASSAPEREMTPEESRALIHEMGVHRIELELQIEELQRMRAELEASQERYFDLYDVAPVGYATLTRKGTILEANLTLAKWLGVDRRTLIGIPLSRFVESTCMDAYTLHLRRLFETEEPSSIELGMVREGGSTIWAWIDTVVHHDESSGSRSCRIAFTDVTQRNKAQEALRQSEEKYRQIVETAHEGIWVIDAHQRTTFVNRRMAEILGHTSEEMLGQPLFAFMNEESRAEAERRLAGGREGTSETRERLYRRKDGSAVWGLLSVNPLFSPSGSYTGALAMVTDITERKRAEHELQTLLEVLDQRVAEKTAELRNAMTYNRSLIETSLDPLVTIDVDGRISDVNGATIRATGVPREQLIGSDFSEYFADSAKARAGFVQVFREGIIRDYELHLRHRDGSTMPVEYNAAVYRDAEGAVAGVFAAARDVSVQKRSAEALRRSEERYRQIVESAHEGIWLIDAGLETTFVNARMAEILGYETEEMLGQPPFAFMPDDTRADAEQQMERWRQGTSDSRERRFRKKDGSEVWTFLSGNPLHSPGGGFAGALAMVTDITERKQADFYREMGRKVLQIFNEPGDLRDSIRRVVDTMKSLTGLDAVGIRLEAGDDFPYFVQEGFPEDFLATENSLVERGPDGGVCRDEGGSVRLECTCGLVISGETDPANPLFTRGGSCWTNNSFPLLDIPPGEDPRLHPRNNCIHQGYASVALVPIRGGGRILGLIQLNDERKGRFTLPAIELLEEAATFIGAALMRRWAEEALRTLQVDLEKRVRERAAELAKSRELLRETARLSRVGGWEYDLRTNELTWTEVTYEIHEVEPGERQTVERGIHFYAAESRPRIQEVFERAAAAGEPFDEELELITAKGRRIWVRVIGNPYVENGRIVRVGGVFQDIHDRKMRMTQLEEANRELEAYSYSISHELRTPLRAIDGHSALIVRDCGALLGNEAQHHFHEVRWNAQRMGRLIDDLLAFSRSGRTQLALSRVDMTGAARAAFARLEFPPALVQRVSFSVDDLPEVVGDAELLGRVWENLLSNAVKFGAAQERPEIHVEGSVENAEAIYRVRDNGIGFDMQYAGKLFGIFQRLHRTHELEGTGVGLALIRRIVVRHGGRVWAEGGLGTGATFSFALPVIPLDRQPSALRA